MYNFPPLIEQASKNNKFDLNTFLNCGLPWLKLDLQVPQFSQQVIDHAVETMQDWRSQWGLIDPNYQVKEWNGTMMFGPADWSNWLELIKDNEFANDEDHLCMIHRKDVEFDWRIPKDNAIRQWINSWLDDSNINIVNTYVLPPGGYLFPHIDPCEHQRALNKIYIAVKWPEGAEFGFLNFGNIPMKTGDAYIINNYRYPHWVLNRSNENRVVLDIGCNLHSIEPLIKQSFLKG